MKKKPKYPLEQVLIVKKGRVEKAKKVVEEKTRALEVEEEKMRKVQKERDTVYNHYQDKLEQMRDAFDQGTTSDEILQMKAYIKVVAEKLVKEDEKVSSQKEQVKNAERNLEEAKKDLVQKRLEKEKIDLHKEQWDKEIQLELAKEEAKEHDEIGQLMYESQKRKQ